MIGAGNPEQGHVRALQPCRVVAVQRRLIGAVFAEHHRRRAGQAEELITLVGAHFQVVEQRRVELPDPAALHLPDAPAHHVPKHARIDVGLLRNEAEAARNGLPVGVNPGLAARLDVIAHGPHAPLQVRFRWADRKVQKDDAAERIAVPVPGFEGHEAAETVADDEWLRAQVGSLAYRPNFIGQQPPAVARPPTAVAVAGRI